MSAKISDLQGIRGIAIIAVLGFHFYPNIMPNGYLGVDQFFVLSGFLMCMLLTKSENMPFGPMLLLFYTRRFKRILPLYQLIIFLALVLIYFSFPETTFESNRTTGMKALVFMSNTLKTDQESYFEKIVNAVDVFTHTWSLSVEVQLYVIVPFIFLLPYKTVSFSIVAMISLLYYYYLPSNMAFLNVSSRVWQFLSGMIAFILREKMQSTYLPLQMDDCEKQQDDESSLIVRKFNSETIVLTSVLLFIVFFPVSISAQATRPLITIVTGSILIYTSGDNLFLSNRVLTYIGDISYSLYLIHWPIHSYWKATHNGNTSPLVFYLVASIILSIIIYHFFEKWYTTSSTWVVVILCSGLFLANAVFLNYHYLTCQLSSDSPSTPLKSFSKPVLDTKKLNTKKSDFQKLDIKKLDMQKLDESKRLNQEWTSHDFANMLQKTCSYKKLGGYYGPFGWCNQTGLNLSNKYKIMIIGNSWGANHGKIIYDECAAKANRLVQGSMCACEPLYPTIGYDGCNEALVEFEKYVEDIKPDYVFHISRYVSYAEKPTDDFASDSIYKFMLERMKVLLKHIKHKLYFLNAIPEVNNDAISTLVDNIKNNITFAEIDKKMNFDTVKYLIVRKRYAQLVKDCEGKCELVDYLNLFYRNETDTFRYFNEFGQSYFTRGRHLTPPALEIIRPVWKEVCDKL